MAYISHMLAHFGKLEKMTHENNKFGKFVDEWRNICDPVAYYRWLNFILAFAKQHSPRPILGSC